MQLKALRYPGKLEAAGIEPARWPLVLSRMRFFAETLAETLATARIFLPALDDLTIIRHAFIEGDATMKKIYSVELSGTSVDEILFEINDRMLAQTGVNPDAIISAESTAVAPPIPIHGGGEATVAVRVYFFKDEK